MCLKQFCIIVVKTRFESLAQKGGCTSAKKAQNNEFVDNEMEKLGFNESDNH